MSEPLDDYLNRVARELRALPPSARENELREVRSHLEQLVEDNIAEGQSRDAATQNALARFGNARAIGICVRDVWEGSTFSWRQLLRALFCGFVFYMIAVFVCMGVYVLFCGTNFHPRGLSIGLVLVVSLALITPLSNGAFFCIYLKRRAWIANLIFWVLLSSITTLLSGYDADVGPSWEDFLFPLLLLMLNVGMGFIGTLVGNAIARRRRNAKWALVNGDSSVSSKQSPSPRRTTRKK